MRNGLTNFVRVWVGILLVLGVAVAAIVPSFGGLRDQGTSDVIGAMVVIPGFVMVSAAGPLAVLMCIGWVVFGGLKK